jgi:hypothetical protein
MEELVCTHLSIFILVEVRENAFGMTFADAGNALEFLQGQEAVTVLIQFIEATQALLEDAGTNGFLSGGFFFIGEDAIAIGVPRIAVRTVRAGRRAIHFTGANRSHKGLAFLFGECAISVHIEGFENFREAAVTERIAFTGVDRRGRDQEGGTE